ncbi:MAG TPA: phosphoribosylformylglycinamidine synthase [Stenotrophobium sp.]|nr:phosphoribosylformylglycinamidine synthase [Stenotrophobium sp.]
MSLSVLNGVECLSSFRIARLLEQLRPQAPGLTGLRVVEFFLVDADGVDAADLRRLLGEGPEMLPAADLTLFVVPRIGTTSPWCSKATDIAHVCGLDGVNRIERGRAYLFSGIRELPAGACAALHDPMMESVLADTSALQQVFDAQPRRSLRTVDVLSGGGVAALEAANRDWGLALSADEMRYLAAHYTQAGKNPTDAELMMFAQVNSEHCRHKIFNAEFTVDGAVQPLSLFQMIKESYKASPQGVLSAYSDNSSVIEGHEATRFFRDPDHVWRGHDERVDILMKVETHNHPTGISPHPGAATGAGGEIRDEAATGRGAKPKAGLCGFTVSNLRIPGFEQAWETDPGKPLHTASALQIMLDGPIGAAAYNNEFGRPNLNGYFRTLELVAPDGRNRGYHKPIMIAGGYGNIRTQHVEKCAVTAGAPLVVLGGPAMLIGLGGAAGSSMATGAQHADLDFASVQRANPELERRCQEVVDACWALGEHNPILSIHDVGAGGISNALPELVHADGRGGHFKLREVLSADPALSPMEIWCNESQERYVLAVVPEGLPLLEAACARERCPYAVVGTATVEQQLIVEDALDGNRPVDMPMPVLLGKPPRMTRATVRQPATGDRESGLRTAVPSLGDAVERVLRLPGVASKNFLITIGDRSVGGLTVRDQMVGPWQVPVADCAVTATAFGATTGEAMSMGERPLIALLDAPASGRMAVGEAITNIACAHIGKLSDVRLSANWMAACGQGDEDARLFDAVKAVGAELCPQLGIAIPVGKDSLSMKSVWQQDGERRVQTAPMSVIISAFAPVADVRLSLTPQLRTDAGETRLLLIDLGAGRNRLGGSALAQVYGKLGEVPPDLDDAFQLKAAFAQVQQHNGAGRLLACHDRSDGGLFVTLCEMAFAGHCGLRIEIDALGPEALAALFSEELGMVLQVRDADAAEVLKHLHAAGLSAHDIGTPADDDQVRIRQGGREIYAADRERLHKIWSETSYRMAAMRDDPDCAREEFHGVGLKSDPGLSVQSSFETDTAPAIIGSRPRVAILREQGVNGQTEMAWAFHAAGFEAVDVHMTDVLEGHARLENFAGLVACGGFSYGDVLGAGQGWARTILFHARARDEFEAFLARDDRFALGVCNGCQMFAALKDIVPGAAHWPAFRRNRSEQFEARWTMVEVQESPSLFFAGMEGSRLPISVAHGEGRAEFDDEENGLEQLLDRQQVSLCFVDNAGGIAEHYPQNPNGSPAGITGVCNDDGRVTILMPHPERTITGTTGSWWPQAYGEFTPWMRMFRNARKWVG